MGSRGSTANGYVKVKNSGMIFWEDKLLLGGTLALGLQFLYVGVRVRFDRSYAWFGVFLLSSLPILAWGLPGTGHFGGAAFPGDQSLPILAVAMAAAPSMVLFVFHVTGVYHRGAFAL